MKIETELCSFIGGYTRHPRWNNIACFSNERFLKENKIFILNGNIGREFLLGYFNTILCTVNGYLIANYTILGNEFFHSVLQQFIETKTEGRFGDFRIFKIGTNIHHLIQVAHQYHYLENGAFPTRGFSNKQR